MNSNHMVLAVAGTFIIATVILGNWIHPSLFYFTAFIGFMLFQSAFTKFCPMGILFRKLGIKPGSMFT